MFTMAGVESIPIVLCPDEIVTDLPVARCSLQDFSPNVLESFILYCSVLQIVILLAFLLL